VVEAWRFSTFLTGFGTLGNEERRIDENAIASGSILFRMFMMHSHTGTIESAS
jgi:hypothetical protein